MANGTKLRCGLPSCSAASRRGAVHTRSGASRASRAAAAAGHSLGDARSRSRGRRGRRGSGKVEGIDVRPRVSLSPDSEGELTRDGSRVPLSSLPLKSVISVDGEVHPEEAEGVEASVFAVFDQAKQLQFVGFSKDLKNSLRAMLGRQSELVFYFKHVDLAEVDQQEMMGIREAWFRENSGPPMGNTPAKAQFWTQPLVAGGVSEKGKQVAAKQMLETISKRLAQRGLREEFLPNDDLLKQGKVDFLPAKELTEEEKRHKRELRMRVLEATKTCSTVVDGKEQEFLLFFENVFEANGGAMVDISVTKDDVATSHRIIIGEDYLEALSLPLKDIVERVVSFLLTKKVSRKTEGMLNSNEFPINYFALSTVEQWFGDFALAFEECEEEEECLPGEGKFWRFNRIHDYGWSADDKHKG